MGADQHVPVKEFDWNTISWVWGIAVFCTVCAVLLSCRLTYKHLVSYTRPDLQLHVVRMLLLVPIYAINSCIGLVIFCGL